MKNPGKLEFETKMMDAGGGGVFILFPYEMQETFGTRGRVKVIATFDGIPYRGSLVNMGLENHVLIVLKAIRAQLGKGPGDILKLTIEVDEGLRAVTVPNDLQKALEENETAQTIFAGFSYSHQREYVLWIEDAKKEETRQRRIEKTISLLMENKKLK
jgi:hypothetical protein